MLQIACQIRVEVGASLRDPVPNLVSHRLPGSAPLVNSDTRARHPRLLTVSFDTFNFSNIKAHRYLSRPALCIQPISSPQRSTPLWHGVCFSVKRWRYKA